MIQGTPKTVTEGTLSKPENLPAEGGKKKRTATIPRFEPRGGGMRSGTWEKGKPHAYTIAYRKFFEHVEEKGKKSRDL